MNFDIWQFAKSFFRKDYFEFLEELGNQEMSSWNMRLETIIILQQAYCCNGNTIFQQV